MPKPTMRARGGSPPPVRSLREDGRGTGPSGRTGMGPRTITSAKATCGQMTPLPTRVRKFLPLGLYLWG